MRFVGDTPQSPNCFEQYNLTLACVRLPKAIVCCASAFVAYAALLVLR